MSLNGTPEAKTDVRGSITKNNTLVINAYDLAVKHGFDGTEAEWIASLKGEKGESYILTVADKTEIAQTIEDEKFSDLEAALDAIITIQESLIPTTFTVKHTTTEKITTFEFKKGMTWSEWCDSEHNTADYFCSGDYVYGGNLSAYIYDDYGAGIMARPEDAIVADKEYYLTQW